MTEPKRFRPTPEPLRKEQNNSNRESGPPIEDADVCVEEVEITGGYWFFYYVVHTGYSDILSYNDRDQFLGCDDRAVPKTDEEYYVIKMRLTRWWLDVKKKSQCLKHYDTRTDFIPFVQEGVTKPTLGIIPRWPDPYTSNPAEITCLYRDYKYKSKTKSVCGCAKPPRELPPKCEHEYTLVGGWGYDDRLNTSPKEAFCCILTKDEYEEAVGYGGVEISPAQFVQLSGDAVLYSICNHCQEEFESGILRVLHQEIQQAYKPLVCCDCLTDFG